MRYLRSFAFISILAILLLISPACAGNGDQPKTLSDDAAVTVTFSPDFKGEALNGDLTLEINVIISNDGYEEFPVHSDDFYVEVAGYKYPANVSTLDDLPLMTGENTSGKLTFIVPPQAATNRVSYEFKHALTKYNLVWSKQAINTALAEDPVIEIAYYTDLMWVSPPGVGFYEVDPPGEMILMAEVRVSNRGYATFPITPDYFSVNVSSVVESFIAPLEGQMIDWRDIDVQNNATYVGRLAFTVDRKIAQSFYPWEYEMIYSGPRTYNIEWSTLNVFKFAADHEETTMGNVTIGDGETYSGRIAYTVTDEISKADADYEMTYVQDVGDNTHYVQWADQTELDVDVNLDPIKYPAIKITYSISFEYNEQRGKTFAMVDVTVENRGYAAFNAAPGNMYLEIRY